MSYCLSDGDVRSEVSEDLEFDVPAKTPPAAMAMAVTDVLVHAGYALLAEVVSGSQVCKQRMQNRAKSPRMAIK